jgi:hypothetical protein
MAGKKSFPPPLIRKHEDRIKITHNAEQITSIFFINPPPFLLETAGIDHLYIISNMFI